jgi:hypothetical protein
MRRSSRGISAMIANATLLVLAVIFAAEIGWLIRC